MKKIIKNKYFIACIIVVIIFILGSIMWKQQTKNNEKKYIIDFARVYTDDQERYAIQRAEKINYSEYLNISRFNVDELNPGKLQSFNFIDSETIEYFNNSFFENKTNNDNIDIYGSSPKLGLI